MFNLFKNSSKPVEVVVESKVNFNRPMNEIVEEIHESFFTEVDRLLKEARISKSLDTDKQSLIDKCEKLRSLGFTNTKEVKEAEIEISRLEALRKENESKKELIEAINYFGFKYPNYKFITEDSVKKICNKYNLIYGSVRKYIGTVPDKNIKQMQEFNIKKEDMAYWVENRRRYVSIYSNESSADIIDYKTHLLYSKDSYYITGVIKMRIAAPKKDFDTTNMEIKDNQLVEKRVEPLDPVVLQPVMFKNKMHYLVVTAWGLEASDELVVNEKMN